MPDPPSPQGCRTCARCSPRPVTTPPTNARRGATSHATFDKREKLPRLTIQVNLGVDHAELLELTRDVLPVAAIASLSQLRAAGTEQSGAGAHRCRIQLVEPRRRLRDGCVTQGRPLCPMSAAVPTGRFRCRVSPCDGCRRRYLASRSADHRRRCEDHRRSLTPSAVSVPRGGTDRLRRGCGGRSSAPPPRGSSRPASAAHSQRGATGEIDEPPHDVTPGVTGTTGGATGPLANREQPSPLLPLIG